MWILEIFNARLSKDGITVPTQTLYTGFGPAKNEPTTEQIPNAGVLPTGNYTIEGPPFDSPEHGEYCLRLVPDALTRAKIVSFGRQPDTFLCHGDSRQHPGQASKGCLVADEVTRHRLWQSGDPKLQVLSGIEPNSVAVGP